MFSDKCDLVQMSPSPSDRAHLSGRIGVISFRAKIAAYSRVVAYNLFLVSYPHPNQMITFEHKTVETACVEF